jgi:8-oxo-dGTP pyrophosphatase MutT (NUDIX family)
VPRVTRHDPGVPRAAVAIVLHERAEGLEMLFIERAQRAGDPWSGHMAFPGGRMGPLDPDARAAAERETYEEVGVDLAKAELLGRLDDLDGPVMPLHLSAFVYHLEAPPRLVPNHEVREAFWVPVSRLLDPAHRVSHPWGESSYPGVLVGEPGRHVVWGLTRSLLERFFKILGRSLPAE